MDKQYYDVQMYDEVEGWLDLEMCNQTKDVNDAKEVRDRLRLSHKTTNFRIVFVEIRTTPIFDSDINE